MLNDKKILTILTFLLVLFVGFLIFKLVLVDRLIKGHEEFLANLPESSEPELKTPLIQASDPALGVKQPQVTIVAFESFSCPYCTQMEIVLKEFLNKYPEKVKIIWKDFISSLNQTGFRAAIAARCAQSQGKFWEFHDALYANQSGLSDSFYKETAISLGLDQSRFNQCFENQETLALVENDFNEGVALAIDGTPYLFINNERWSGLATLEDLEKFIK